MHDFEKWKRSIDDYKASDGWTLKYSFRGTAGTIDITSSADGDEHLISLSPTTTAAYDAGMYDVQGYVEIRGQNGRVVTSTCRHLG